MAAEAIAAQGMSDDELAEYIDLGSEFCWTAPLTRSAAVEFLSAGMTLHQLQHQERQQQNVQQPASPQPSASDLLTGTPSLGDLSIQQLQPVQGQSGAEAEADALQPIADGSVATEHTSTEHEQQPMHQPVQREVVQPDLRVADAGQLAPHRHGRLPWLRREPLRKLRRRQ